MNLQELSMLERNVKYVDELIVACQKRSRLYCENPKLVADVSRKAKWLRSALLKLQDGLKKPTQV